MSSSSTGKRKASESDDTASDSNSKAQKSQEKVCQKQNGFQSEIMWTMRERELLLAALKMHSASNVERISQFVKSKSPEEVSEMIESIRGKSTLKQHHNKLEDKTTAPLEAWLPLARELVWQEPTDLSANLSNIINMIGRNEVPTKSIHPDLNWQNIYQYLSNLLGDRCQLKPLSNLESYVVLDLMHDLGNTLRNSVTDDASRILNQKYKLLKTHPLCFPGVSHMTQLTAMALTNDFSLIETEAPSPSTSSSSSLMAPSISNSSSTPVDKSATTNLELGTKSTDFSDTSLDAQSTSSFTNAKDGNSRSSARDESETIFKVSGNGSENDATADTAFTPESGFARPQFYTLNPFCIPSDLLTFKAKSS